MDNSFIEHDIILASKILNVATKNKTRVKRV